ncbi:MAG: ABC transporter permease [Bacteroidota bacterium]
MPTRFEHFLAWRYLFGAPGPPKAGGFKRFIVGVALGGVAVGVAALLLALTIVRGFSQEIEAKIVGFGAHVQVESYTDEPLDGVPTIAAQLFDHAGVTSVAPVVQEFALLRRSAGTVEGVALSGTDQPPTYLRDQVIEGVFSFEPDEAGRPGLVVGVALARLLQLEVGAIVTAFSMRDDFARLPSIRQFYVAGLYETDLSNFDELYVYTDIEVARRLLMYGPDQATRLDVTLADPTNAQAVAEAVSEELGFPYLARSIYDVFSGLFAWVNLQQSIIPLVVGIIVLVAAFNIIGILLMIVLENTRAIGVLGSMGASPQLLRRSFLAIGFWVGVLGTLVGEALALALAFAQLRYDLIPLPAEAYYMQSAPIALNPLDFVVVGVLTIVLCMGASYIPARVAGRIDPVRAIRFN